MSSLRKRASKFFHSHSSRSSSDALRVPADGSFELDSKSRHPSRSLSLPASDFGIKSEVNVLAAWHDRHSSETTPVASSAIVTPRTGSPTVMPIAYSASPDMATVPDGDVMVSKQLAVIADTADDAIHAERMKLAERAQREEETRMSANFRAKWMLELKRDAREIELGLKSALAEDQWLGRVLDAAAESHPFIKLLVATFKAAYQLQITPQQNDKRIIALYKEMKDMMGALARLKDIKDPDVAGPNGAIITGKLQFLVGDTEQEILKCANACDAWKKTRNKILLRVLVGPAWEDRLAHFSASFTTRRRQFEFALGVHTAVTVDHVHIVTRSIRDDMSDLKEFMRHIYKQFRPTDEAHLCEIVESMGGVQAVRSNERSLRELFGKYDETARSKGKQRSKGTGISQEDTDQDGDGTKNQRSAHRSIQKSEYTFDDLKVDLRQDWDAALDKNMKMFNRTFELALRRQVQEGTDRVINEMHKGPHELIRDPELRIIWEEMNWRRNVKARMFVMTLRDYFSEKTETPMALASNNVADTDEWTRQYIHFKFLQSIMDAIDDDGSGHVTIVEINRFTDLMPASLGWSLAHWVAYWAIGWQTFAARYRTEILQIFARMFAMREQVLPANRNWVEYYLRLTWETASELAKSLNAPATTIPDYVEEQFEKYVQFEEDRICKNLIGIKYDIDALETVYSVVGTGRIEKHVLMLICLILRRDLELFRRATEVELDVDELWDAADTMLHIFEAVSIRYRELVEHCREQKVDVDKQMKAISCELFDYYHSDQSWKLSNLSRAYELEPNNEELPSAQLGGLPANNYDVRAEWPYRCEVYDIVPYQPSAADVIAADFIKPFLGRWNGFIHDDDGYALDTIFTFDAHVASSGETHHIEAHAMSHGLPFTLRATITAEGTDLKIKAVVKHDIELASKHYSGVLQSNGFIVGSQGPEDDESLHTAHFVWAQLPAEMMTLRPMLPYYVPSKTDNPIVPNKARALFDYAIKAVILQNRKKSWSWSYFRQRRDDRLRYLDYRTLQEATDIIDPYADDPLRRNQALQSVTSTDRILYDSVWDRVWRMYPDHNACCDVCNKSCRGARYICIDCLENATPHGRYGDLVDFCSLACSQSTLHSNPKAVKQPHNPSHDVLKKRVVLQYRDMPLAYRQAQAAIASCRQRFSRVSPRRRDDVSDTETDNGMSFRSIGPDLSKDNAKLPECSICHKAVAMPCWFCIECSREEGPESKSPLICDSCEENSLLACITCTKSFKQPSWYYGFGSHDNFMCNLCIVRRVPVQPIGKKKLHTYVHALIRCHVKEDNITERSTDERIAALESTVAGLDTKVDSLLTLSTRMERIERLLEQMMTVQRYIQPPS